VLWRSSQDVLPVSAAFVDSAHVTLSYPWCRERRAWPSFELLSDSLAEPLAPPRGDLREQVAHALGGHVDGIAEGPAGLVAATFTQVSYPPWYRVVIWSGSPQAMTSLHVRIWGKPCWSLTGELAVTAFDGIRRGIVAVDPGSGATHWWRRPGAASYRLLALAPGGQDALAVRLDHDGSVWLVRAVCGGTDHRLQMLRQADQVPVRVVSWEHAGITLEGLLAVPAGGGPHPLVVLLHGGPVGGLACGEHPDPSAWASGDRAVFMPDFRASGIAGHDHMMEAFQRPGLPAVDPEAGDVLAGVDMLTASGLADPRALFLAGHSYGGYLAGRILARDHRFRAATCCDAIADLRILDAASQQMQASWLGGDARRAPRRWAAASPVVRAADIRTPMLLVYSGLAHMADQGQAWHASLTAARTKHKLVILDDADHAFSSTHAQRRLHQEVTDWFDQHSHA
jgi:dipeptidyl aminopeptidase/acylaminoacyl peptidase